MSCGACTKHVTNALQAVPGVGEVEVNLSTGRVRVQGSFPAGSAPLLQSLAAAGYPAKVSDNPEVVPSTKTSGCGSSASGHGGCCCS
ncbi:MAG: heavy metal-associated domain-containing protein [Burkholderiaceae bacterium]|nr:heavy metal-associated domain-containing protein [Burkholderiaceae bacterium]